MVIYKFGFNLLLKGKLIEKILIKLLKSLKNYDVSLFKLSANERNKSLTVANKIIQQLLKKNFNRSDCLIAFGGGVLGDLSAFISSLTKRGIKFVNIPTTLLAQVDASIGGKTGINSDQGKNLIGSFLFLKFAVCGRSSAVCSRWSDASHVSSAKHKKRMRALLHAVGADLV